MNISGITQAFLYDEYIEYFCHCNFLCFLPYEYVLKNELFVISGQLIAFDQVGQCVQMLISFICPLNRSTTKEMEYAITITLFFPVCFSFVFEIFCFVVLWPSFTCSWHDSCFVEGLRLRIMSQNSFYNRCPCYCLGLREKEEKLDNLTKKEETLGTDLQDV